MDERICELEDQCWIKVPCDFDMAAGGASTIRTVFDRKKFAELIVRECMTIVLKESKWYWDKNEVESSNAIQNAARRLKEQFKVQD